LNDEVGVQKETILSMLNDASTLPEITKSKTYKKNSYPEKIHPSQQTNCNNLLTSLLNTYFMKQSLS